MNKLINYKFFILSFIIIFPFILSATENPKNLPAAADLFHNLDRNMVHSFSNGYGLYHMAAIGLSYGVIKSGADWQYYSYMQDHQSISRVGFAGVLIGGLIPLTVPFYLYFKGKSNKDAKLMYTALALGQSVMTSLLVTSSYKAITGRKPPEDLHGNESDYSDDFNFGFMRRGIFEGWPSGHTTNAFAMATVLWEMYPENETIKLYSGIYAFYIGLSVSTNIHWFSDFVAGALMGYSIGKSVGESFKNLSEGKISENRTSFFITPNGVNFTIRF